MSADKLQPPSEGGDIVLRLVVRPAGSTLALPKDASLALMKDEEIPWHFAADTMDFARVMRGTTDYMIEQYDDEIHQLEQLERHDELMFGDDNEWTQRAIRSCQEAKERTKSTKSDGVTTPTPSGTPQATESPTPASTHKPASALSQSIAEYRAQKQGAPTGPSDYHFYQALQHYYLSSLDVRILKAAFGSYAAFPSTILPRVERVSTGHIIDDDLRKRHKYLSHLPHGCECAFLECDWTDTVPKEVLDHFSNEIEKRRKRNADKAAQDEKDRVRAEKEEDEKRWREARRVKRPQPDFAADDSGSTGLDPDEFQPILGTPTSLQGQIADREQNPGLSNSYEGTRSGFGALASPSSSPSATRTVWGTAAITPTSPPTQAQEPTPVDDGWLQDWEKELLDHDLGLVEQMEGVGLESHGPSNSNAGSSAKKKGKKNKKITLMSTSQRRGP